MQKSIPLEIVLGVYVLFNVSAFQPFYEFLVIADLEQMYNTLLDRNPMIIIFW